MRGSFVGQRPPLGGNRNGRGPGNERFGDHRNFPQQAQFPNYGQGDIRGRRNFYPQWRPRGTGRGNLHNQTRDGCFDLRENLNQNRCNMEGGDPMTEGSRKVDDPQLKDLDHSEHTNKLEGDQDQGITAEKKG